MSGFWPSGIDVQDTRSPREILKVAQEDWSTSSSGIMVLIINDAMSKAGNPMIIVRAKHVPTNRTAKLFSVIHRPDKPYPATFQLEEEELPNFLKRSYVRPGRSLIGIEALMGTSISTQEKTVSNPWVSDTPSEFEKNLKAVFNDGVIRGQILNLLADSSSDMDTESKEDSPEDQGNDPNADR